MGMKLSAGSAFLLASVSLSSVAGAQEVRAYDFSTGLLPGAQGWGLAFVQDYGPEYDTSATNGTNPSAPTFVDGAMCSDNTGLPFSSTGHQWWWEWSPMQCLFRTTDGFPGTGAFMEADVRVIASSYAEGLGLRRSGWNASFGDWYYLASFDLTDTGYYVSNDLNQTVAAAAIPLRPFDTTSAFHRYRIEAREDELRFLIDGVVVETVPYGPIYSYPGYPFATFGDSQGALGVSSNTCVRSFRYGCLGDEDGDGVLDDLDECPGTAAGATVSAVGCSGAQLVEESCGTYATWQSHFASYSDYYKCVWRAAYAQVHAGLLTRADKDAIIGALPPL